MLKKIISGGQFGADLGGLKAAIVFNLPTGGWAPAGFKTEQGSNIDLKENYGLKETPSSGYSQRTEWNVRDSDATIILSRDFMSKGTVATLNYCKKHKKNVHRVPFISRQEHVLVSGESILEFLHFHSIEILNIAGNRESVAPGIENWVTRVFLYVFHRLKKEELLFENH